MRIKFNYRECDLNAFNHRLEVALENILLTLK